MDQSRILASPGSVNVSMLAIDFSAAPANDIGELGKECRFRNPEPRTTKARLSWPRHSITQGAHPS
jgi:hypothetical protein